MFRDRRRALESMIATAASIVPGNRSQTIYLNNQCINSAIDQGGGHC